jgi:peptide-methionine (S)-S-oxide reductase
MRTISNLFVALLLALTAAMGVLSIARGSERPTDSADQLPQKSPDMEPLMQNPTFDQTLSPTGHSVPPPGTRLEYATFGAGCFWGVEALFRSTPGVVATAVGFAGGRTENPSYKQVCYTDTGHAEVVHLQFDPAQVSFERLLDLFWNNHNPTTLNRQGPDIGSQYRSVIFYHSDTQKQAAEASKAAQQKSGKWASRTIVTFIEPAQPFYKAEDDHQRYLEKQGLSSCHAP